MVGYDGDNNALTLGDDDSLSVGDYELEYSAGDDQWQARYGRPIGGEAGYHGSIYGVPYVNDSNVGNHSLEFDSNLSEYVELTDSTFWPVGSSEVSVSLWAKVETVNDGFAINSDNPDANAQLAIWYDEDNSNWAGGISSGGSQDNLDDTGQTDPTGVWSLVTLVYDGTDLIIYVDGSEAGRTPVSGTVDRTNNIIIGSERQSGTEQRAFVGNIDDVRFYDRALTSSEVTDLSNGVNVTNGLLARYDFEYPETPDVAIDSTGDVYPKNSVPRSTSDSLVPQGLAESVSAGEALADDGNTYTSVQTAVNNATGWVFVGPGTFNENVTISTTGLTLEGCGDDTLIDGGTSGDAVTVDSDDVTIRNLSVQTTSGSGNTFDCIKSNDADNGSIENVTVVDSDNNAFHIDSGTSQSWTVTNCRIVSCDIYGIRLPSQSIASDNVIESCGDYNIIVTGDDSAVSNNSCLESINLSNIRVTSNDTIIIGNRVTNAADNGIYVTGTDNIIANNRASDSANMDINDGGTGTVLDDNLTGPSN